MDAQQSQNEQSWKACSIVLNLWLSGSRALALRAYCQEDWDPSSPSLPVVNPGNFLNHGLQHMETQVLVSVCTSDHGRVLQLTTFMLVVHNHVWKWSGWAAPLNYEALLVAEPCSCWNCRCLCCAWKKTPLGPKRIGQQSICTSTLQRLAYCTSRSNSPYPPCWFT